MTAPSDKRPGAASPVRIEVFVRLLDEGVEVFRPTSAHLVGPGLAVLHPAPRYDPEDERWEFLPGSTVRVERRLLDGGEEYVAVEVDAASHGLLSEQEVLQIQRRCEAATPGPWRAWIEGRDHDSGCSFVQVGPEGTADIAELLT